MFNKKERELEEKLEKLKNMSQKELEEALFKVFDALKEHLEKRDFDRKPKFTIHITTETQKHGNSDAAMMFEVEGTKRDLMHGLAEISLGLLEQSNLDEEDILSAVNMGIDAYHEKCKDKED